MFDRLRVSLLKRLENINDRSARLASPPDEFESLQAKGNALVQKGNFQDAEHCYRKALVSRPNDDKTLVNLGFVLKEQKRLVEARVYLRRAMTQAGDDPAAYETHYLFGLVTEEQGNLAEATASFSKASELKPDFELACRDLCRVLFMARRLKEAQVVLARGLALNPGYADFHFYQGNLHVENKQSEMAAQSYSEAVALGANYAGVYTALATVLYQLGNKEAALENFQIAQRLDPEVVAEAQYQSGCFFLRNGDILNATANFEIATVLRPDFWKAHSNLLCSLSFNPTCSPENYIQAAKSYGAILSARAKSFEYPQRHSSEPESGVLKIGFVSGDFKAHPVGFFLEGILRDIDPARIQLIAYSNNSSDDQNTERLRALFAQWHVIRNLSDDDAAHMIHDHRIDILVDLAGHTADNRMPVFARRPAPVQVTWLGYFASTGLVEMDYILADHFCAPEQSAQFFSEKIWYLPDTRLCMTPPVTQLKIAVAPLPAQSSGHVTFGSFQSRTKISQHVLSVWARVLTAVPDSRLRLQIPEMDIPAHREALLQRLDLAGIDRERVSLSGGVHWEAYLAAYNQVDILLDTFPYPGGTTTAEALWMGVPTVTMMGDTMLSRQGASMLNCIGLEDWIASSETDYIEKAVQFANDVPALARLRGELREKALKSPLFDTHRFAGQLQDCFENIYKSTAAQPLIRVG